MVSCFKIDHKVTNQILIPFLLFLGFFFLFVVISILFYNQQACYANDEMYQIMKTGSTAYLGCQDGRGEYPTGGTMGKAFCLFDTLGLVRITGFYLVTFQRI